ncbi:MAG: hypothetical protein GVY27_09840 [Deinococcus-Thermus bacterium]|jgi:hypothetical protein|nr:hypothetical protein [Deinococcota bacterium]
MHRASIRRKPPGIAGLALGAGLVALGGCGLDLTQDADIPLNTTAQVGVPPAALNPPPTPPRAPAPPPSLGAAAARSFALSGPSGPALADASRHPGMTAGPIGETPADPTALAGDGDGDLVADLPAAARSDDVYLPYGQGDAEIPADAWPEEIGGDLPDVESIVGYPEDDLRRLLGDPTTIEERPPAFTWQYASESCTLDLTFFLEVGTNIYRVLSYDLKTSREDVSDVDRRCLVELLQSASSG